MVTDIDERRAFMNFKVPKEHRTFYQVQSEKWQHVERIIRDLCKVYRYKEIRTPMFRINRTISTRCRGYNGYRTKRNVYVYG